MNQPASLQTSIYEDLRERLFVGDVAAGERLSEQQLAEDFQASRMPVRQALARLAHEGLIEQSSRVRSAVVNPTLADLQESVELRCLLEPHAAELATPRLDWVSTEKLEAACQQIAAVAAAVTATGIWSEDDRRNELHADLTFHRVIWETADRPRLAKMCDDLHLIWRIGIPVGVTEPNVASTLQKAAGYHQRVLAAMKSGDAQAAAERMREHTESNRAALTRLARQWKPEG